MPITNARMRHLHCVASGEPVRRCALAGCPGFARPATLPRAARGALLAGLAGLHALPTVAGVMFIPEPARQLAPHQLCVASAAQVGDATENIDGDRMVIQSIAGKFASSFSPCSSPGQPLLAEVQIIEAAEFHPAFTLDLPATFTSRTLSDIERFELYRARAYSSTEHMWLAARSWDRRKLPDLESFAAEQKQLQTLPGNVTQTPTEHLTVQGIPALRWQTESRRHFLAPDTSSVTTVLIGDSEVAVLIVTGITFKIGKSRDGLARIAEGARGLTSGAPAPQPP
jgi:hypothetical protein